MVAGAAAGMVAEIAAAAVPASGLPAPGRVEETLECMQVERRLALAPAG